MMGFVYGMLGVGLFSGWFYYALDEYVIGMVDLEHRERFARFGIDWVPFNRRPIKPPNSFYPARHRP